MRVGDDLVVHAPPGEPVPVTPPAPELPRARARQPVQLRLFATPRTPRTAREQAVQEALRGVLPPDMAAAAEQTIHRAAKQFQRRFPKDIGPTRTGKFRKVPEGTAGEHVIGLEDLQQEGLRMALARQRALERIPLPTASAIDRYLYPKVRKAMSAYVAKYVDPVVMAPWERAVTTLASKVQKQYEQYPNVAALMSRPAAIFELLAKNPKAVRLAKREGTTGLLTPEGVEHTLTQGMFQAKRGPEALSKLEAARTPLDELLEKEAAKQTSEVTPALARLRLLLETLPTRQREVVERHLGLTGPAMGWTEIAAELKISKQAAQQAYKAAEKKITAALKGVAYKRPATTREIAEGIRERARQPVQPSAAKPKSEPVETVRAPREPDLSRWVRPQRVIRSEVLPPRPAPVPRSGAEATLPSRDLAELGPVKYPPRPLPPRRTPPPRIYSGLYPALQRQALWYDLLRRIQGR